MEEPAFELWLEFEQWIPQEGDDPENDFFIMHIKMPGGVTYALNVWTFKVLEGERLDNQQQGRYLSGSYLFPPDLFVERLDRPLMERVIADLIKRGYMKDEWIVEKYEADGDEQSS